MGQFQCKLLSNSVSEFGEQAERILQHRDEKMKTVDVLVSDPPLVEEDIHAIFMFSEEDNALAGDIIKAFKVGEVEVEKASKLDFVKNFFSSQFNVLGFFNGDDDVKQQATTLNEFVCLVVLLSEESLQGKINFLFNYFDSWIGGRQEGDGMIDKRELAMMVKSMCGALKIMIADKALTQHQLATMVTNLDAATREFLKEADVEVQDGKLSQHEFITAVESQRGKFGEMLYNMLNGSLPTMSVDVAGLAGGNDDDDEDAGALEPVQVRPQRRSPGDTLFRIVALDSGGMRLRFTLGVIAALEERTAGFCGSVDLWTGTGLAAIAAALFAMGYAPRSVIQMFEEDAPRILEEAQGGLLDKLKPGTKYSSEPLQELLQSKFGHLRWRHLKKMAERKSFTHLVIPTFHLKLADPAQGGDGDKYRWGMHVYTTLPMSPWSESAAEVIDDDGEEFVWRILMAAAAAPSFFEPFDDQIDGSLACSNPSALALSFVVSASCMVDVSGEAVTKENVRLLSIGAGRYPNDTGVEDFKHGGAGFVVHGKIDDLFRASVEGTDECTHFVCRAMLADNQYRRFDTLVRLTKEDSKKLTLDCTDRAALDRLERHARRAVHEDDLFLWIQYSNFLRRSFIKNCTFGGDELPVEQTMYVCETCDLRGENNMGFCQACYEQCHRSGEDDPNSGHKAYIWARNVKFFCKCGHRSLIGAQKKESSLSKIADDSADAQRIAQYAGNGIKHPCESLPDAMSAQKCTYNETMSSKEEYVQDKYQCEQCGLTEPLGCCYVCFRQCHRGHEGARRAKEDVKGFQCHCGHFQDLGKQAADANKRFEFPKDVRDECRRKGILAWDARTMCRSMPDTLPGHTAYHQHPLVIAKVQGGFRCQGRPKCVDPKNFIDTMGSRAAVCPRDGYKLCLKCFEKHKLVEGGRGAAMQLSATSAFAEKKVDKFIEVLLPSWSGIITVQDAVGSAGYAPGKWLAQDDEEVLKTPLQQLKAHRVGITHDGRDIFSCRYTQGKQQYIGQIVVGSNEAHFAMPDGKVVTKPRKDVKVFCLPEERLRERVKWLPVKANDAEDCAVPVAARKCGSGHKGEPLYVARHRRLCSAGHVLDFTGVLAGPYRGWGWGCNECGRTGTGARWHCMECYYDRCTHHPEDRFPGTAVGWIGQNTGPGGMFSVNLSEGKILREPDCDVLSFTRMKLPTSIGSGTSVLIWYFSPLYKTNERWIPALNALHKEVSREKLEVVGLTSMLSRSSTADSGKREAIRQLEEYVARHSIQFAVCLDVEQDFKEWCEKSKSGGAKPSVFLFDASGKLEIEEKMSNYQKASFEADLKPRILEISEKPMDAQVVLKSSTAAIPKVTKMKPAQVAARIEQHITKGESVAFRAFIAELKAKKKLSALEDWNGGDEKTKFTPLCWAVKHGQVEALLVMLSNQQPSLFNPNFERDPENYMFPLYLAIKARNITMVEYLGRHFDFKLKCKVPRPASGDGTNTSPEEATAVANVEWPSDKINPRDYALLLKWEEGVGMLESLYASWLEREKEQEAAKKAETPLPMAAVYSQVTKHTAVYREVAVETGVAMAGALPAQCTNCHKAPVSKKLVQNGKADLEHASAADLLRRTSATDSPKLARKASKVEQKTAKKAEKVAERVPVQQLDLCDACVALKLKKKTDVVVEAKYQVELRLKQCQKFKANVEDMVNEYRDLKDKKASAMKKSLDQVLKGLNEREEELKTEVFNAEMAEQRRETESNPNYEKKTVDFDNDDSDSETDMSKLISNVAKLVKK